MLASLFSRFDSGRQNTRQITRMSSVVSVKANGCRATRYSMVESGDVDVVGLSVVSVAKTPPSRGFLS